MQTCEFFVEFYWFVASAIWTNVGREMTKSCWKCPFLKTAVLLFFFLSEAEKHILYYFYFSLNSYVEKGKMRKARGKATKLKIAEFYQIYIQKIILTEFCKNSNFFWNLPCKMVCPFNSLWVLMSVHFKIHPAVVQDSSSPSATTL